MACSNMKSATEIYPNRALGRKVRQNVTPQRNKHGQYSVDVAAIHFYNEAEGTKDH